MAAGAALEKSPAPRVLGRGCEHREPGARMEGEQGGLASVAPRILARVGAARPGSGLRARGVGREDGRAGSSRMERDWGARGLSGEPRIEGLLEDGRGSGGGAQGIEP